MDATILVVDDALFARNMVKRALKNGGYEHIVEASSAAEAVERFTEHKPDLTLLDITLSDSNDLTLLAKLLELNPEAKIVMCSAIGQDLIIADALNTGAKDFITKPFDEQDLIAVVMSVLSDE